MDPQRRAGSCRCGSCWHAPWRVFGGSLGCSEQAPYYYWRDYRHQYDRGVKNHHCAEAWIRVAETRQIRMLIKPRVAQQVIAAGDGEMGERADSDQLVDNRHIEVLREL